MSNNKIEELQELQNTIKKADKKVGELEGRKAVLLEQLLKKYDCKTVKQAERKLQTFRKELVDLDAQFTAQMKSIEDLKEDIDLSVLEEE